MNKSQLNLMLRNGMVEDVIFVPRLVPFTFKTAIQKISCGNKFSIALSKVLQLISTASVFA